MTRCFDYVIVGAGSSGATLAARLSEDPSVSVCLIEAGPRDTHPAISIPLGLIWLSKHPKLNWLYTSTAQEGLGGRQVSVPRGKVLGGSSAINGMIYIRGQAADYDGWAAQGCAGWSFDDVLPYFMRSEGNSAPGVDPTFHGSDGPLSVQRLTDPSPMNDVFIEAAGQLQYRQTRDFNGADQEGVGVYQVTQSGGSRMSTAHAFLKNTQTRPNLHIETDAVVSKVVMSEATAQAVRLKRNDGQTEDIEARIEIILSAGAIGSPELLLRSGIGPGPHLRACGIAVHTALPGVGANLQDHVDCMVICESTSRTPYGISMAGLPRLSWEGLRYVFGRRGMLSSNMVEGGGFIRSAPDQDQPDLQFHFIPGRKSHRGKMLEWGHGVSLHTCVLRPKSRGSLTLDPSRVDGDPLIDLGLLRHEDDLRLLTKGVGIAREILRQDPFKPHGLTEILPGKAVDDDDLESFVRANARTVYHPVGTCAMGTGPDAVTDPNLRVHGVQNLRVVDASIMPTIVSGNTNAPAIMIAEKAADLIATDRRERTKAA